MVILIETENFILYVYTINVILLKKQLFTFVILIHIYCVQFFFFFLNFILRLQ